MAVRLPRNPVRLHAGITVHLHRNPPQRTLLTLYRCAVPASSTLPLVRSIADSCRLRLTFLGWYSCPSQVLFTDPNGS
jgi:hypothetical protein